MTRQPFVSVHVSRQLVGLVGPQTGHVIRCGITKACKSPLACITDILYPYRRLSVTLASCVRAGEV